MRGRYPTPIPIREKLGNPGKRARATEPNVRRLRPEVEPWLDPIAADFIARHQPELERAGVLTVVDGPALSMAADRFAEYQAWRGLIRHYGIAKSTALGYVREMRRCEGELRRWCGEIGLTALSRTRLAQRDGGGLGDDDESDLDAM